MPLRYSDNFLGVFRAIKEEAFMEIKRVNGVISAYKTQRNNAVKKSSASASAKNIDRVEFGFDTALQAAKNGIAAEVKADASAQEIAAAKETAEQGISASELAGYIIVG